VKQKLYGFEIVGFHSPMQRCRAIDQCCVDVCLLQQQRSYCRLIAALYGVGQPGVCGPADQWQQDN
jgi:hypothetical protein